MSMKNCEKWNVLLGGGKKKGKVEEVETEIGTTTARHGHSEEI